MKIALLGTKGIPAKWGGIEKYVEEISVRLAAMGHEVTVLGSKWYCRGYRSRSYKSVRVVQLPTLHTQATDALGNGCLASLYAIFHKFDIVNFHGYASYFFLPFVRRMNIKTVVTPHGVESGWDNPKYGILGKSVLKKAFLLGIRKADAVVTVARHLKKNIETNFGIDAEVIYSGLDAVEYRKSDIITRKYGLFGNDYVYFIGRIDPIKRVHWLTDLPRILPPGVKMVISGGAQDASTEKYLNRLKENANQCKSLIFTGPVTGDEKAELFSNCIGLLSPSKNEGLPLTLLEAASYGKGSLASAIPAHTEVIKNGTNGFLFPNGNKEAFFDMTLRLLTKERNLWRETGGKARQMAIQRFDWDRTAGLYDRLFTRLRDDDRTCTRNRTGCKTYRI